MQYRILTLGAAIALAVPLAVAAQAPVKIFNILDRESDLVKVVNGKQVVTETLPPASK